MLCSRAETGVRDGAAQAGCTRILPPQSCVPERVCTRDFMARGLQLMTCLLRQAAIQTDKIMRDPYFSSQQEPFLTRHRRKPLSHLPPQPVLSSPASPWETFSDPSSQSNPMPIIIPEVSSLVPVESPPNLSCQQAPLVIHHPSRTLC